jgi:hypothetical protein
LRSILEEETAADLQKVDLQHINVKLLLDGPQLQDDEFDAIIPTFHNWIQEQVFDGLLIDVADYRHVQHGPGIVLIGHEADYSIDNTDGRLGLRYNRKTQLAGTAQEKLTQAFRSALNAIQRLEADMRLNGKLHFNRQDIDLFINDRLLAPANDQIRQAADPEFRTFFGKLFAGAEYSLRYGGDPRKLFGAAIHSEREFPVEELLQNLA